MNNLQNMDVDLSVAEKIIILAADYISPFDVYRTLPLVSRSFYELVKTHFPRNIIATYVQVKELPKSSNMAQKWSKSQMSRVTPLENWRRLPETLAQHLRSGRAGLSITILYESDPETNPRSVQDIPLMMKVTRGLVHRMLQGQGPLISDQPELIETDVVLVPWEYRAHRGCMKNKEEVEIMLQSLEIYQNPKIVLINPDSLTSQLIPNFIKHLKLVGINETSERIDWTRISCLKHLQELYLVGSGPESESLDLYSAKDLAPLVKLAPTLKKLVICRWFPIDNYSIEFLEILAALVNLESLTIHGLYEGDQESQHLALVLSRLNKLKELDQLGHLDKAFWFQFCRLTGRQGHPTLERFVLELDLYTSFQCMGAIMMAFTKLLPVLSHVTLKFTECPDFIKCIPGMQKLDLSKVLDLIHLWSRSSKHKNLKRITLIGLEVPLDGIEKLAQFNFQHTFPKVDIQKLEYC